MQTCTQKDPRTVGYDGARYLIRPAAAPGMTRLARAITQDGRVFDLFRGSRTVNGHRFLTACAVPAGYAR